MQAMSYACLTLVTPTKLHDYMNHGIYLTLIPDLSMGLKLGTLIASLSTDANNIKLYSTINNEMLLNFDF